MGTKNHCHTGPSGALSHPKYPVSDTKTMPTYEYECQKCGHPFEAVQSMKDPHLKDCPRRDARVR